MGKELTHREMSQRGGQARAVKLSKKRRKQIARLGAIATNKLKKAREAKP